MQTHSINSQSETTSQAPTVSTLPTSFTKVIRLGKAKTHGGRGYSIFCKIQFMDGRLSITGVEGPLPSGNALGGCGQIDMTLRNQQATITPVNGITRGQMAQFFKVWDRYHLNDMKAGDAVQEAFLRDHPMAKESYAYPKSHYTVACEYLAAHGLNPHDGYNYGSAWKREEVPADVIAFLQSLPNSDVVPAWV